MKRPTLTLSFSRAEAAAAIASWFLASRVDIAIVAALTVLAAVPRLVLLESIPPGLHGDEAWTGLNANQILDEGWIGPYVSSALGYPAGPLYFATPFVKVFGDTIFAVRLSMAVLGILTIPIAYLAFRVMFDRTLAVFAGIFLSIGVWHLHYSRIGFPIVSWPFIFMVTVLFFFLGVKTKRWIYFVPAGLSLGAGIHSYNAHPVFGVALGAVVAWIVLWMLVQRRRAEIPRFVGQVVLMVGLAVVAAFPMIQYALDSDNNYFNRLEGISVLDGEEWKSGNLIDKAEILKDQSLDFIKAAFWEGAPDGADGAGHQAMVDRVTLVLIVIGLGLFLWRWRQPAAVAVLIMVVLLPAATIVTTNGLFRQSIGIVPFLAVLAAAPLALVWRRAGDLPPRFRNASYIGVAAVIAVVGYFNMSFYFDEFEDTPIAQFTFVTQLTDASLYIGDLEGQPWIYFYSGRWSFFYETRRFLAPDVAGEDRSSEFRDEFSLEAERSLDLVYVFLPPYLSQIDEVELLYPGGTRVDGGASFQAYELPADPDAPPPVPSRPTAEPSAPADGAEAGSAQDRDTIRVSDLEEIERALAEYRQRYDSYPSTEGSVQSLCAYVDLDVGCALQEVLTPLPQDPLGEATSNGYWYASDGTTYTVYAQRESDPFPPCEEHASFFVRFESILCAKGP